MNKKWRLSFVTVFLKVNLFSFCFRTVFQYMVITAQGVIIKIKFVTEGLKVPIIPSGYTKKKAKKNSKNVVILNMESRRNVKNLL